MITLAITTTEGRLNLLTRTLTSLMENTGDVYKNIIINDNSCNSDNCARISDLVSKFSQNFLILRNGTNNGQVEGIDNIYKLVNTKYIFHLEDDWEFYNGNFIHKSIDVLESNPKITNVSIRQRDTFEASSQHPVHGPFFTQLGTEYYKYHTGYKGIWHGFSWNPGLRRLSDYKLIGSYKQYINEQGVGNFYYQNGFESACLKDFYCAHIGHGQSTFKRNE